MSYFDHLTDFSFKPTNDNRVAYFPHGLLGPGYILPTRKDFEQARQLHKRLTVVGFSLLLLGLLWSPSALVTFPIFGASYVRSVARAISGLQLVADREIVPGLFGNQAARLRIALVLAFQVILLALIAFAVWLLFNTNRGGLGVRMIGVCLAGLVAGCQAIVLNVRAVSLGDSADGPIRNAS